LAREALQVIIRLAGQAPHRRPPLSSNVRPHILPNIQENEMHPVLLAFQLGFLAMLGALAALLHYQFGYGLWASFWISITALAGLFVAWVATSGAKRMSYSEPASEALQQFARKLQERLVAEDAGVTRVTSMWAYGYPKIALLFSSKEALDRAESSALLSRLASEVSEFICGSSVFGENRKSFDAKQSLFFTADIQSWNLMQPFMVPKEPL
jgi:hypothetical protein